MYRKSTIYDFLYVDEQYEPIIFLLERKNFRYFINVK